jgi:hypothetical protein
VGKIIDRDGLDAIGSLARASDLFGFFNSPIN